MLTIVVILAQTRRAMPNLELAKWTGLTDKTLARYLDKLETKGRILRTATGWMLTQGFQLELFDTLRVLSDTAPIRTTLSVNTEILRLEPLNPLIIINDSAYLNPLLFNNNNNKDPESEILRLYGQSCPNSDDLESGLPSRSSDELAALNAMLVRYKIIGKKADELRGCDWVSAAYVRAHVEFAKAEEHGQYSIGIAITRMLARIEQPTFRENGHIENCECAECKTASVLAKYSIPVYLDDDDIEMHCLWQDELDELFETGPLRGQHRKAPMCGKVVTNGSIKWCDEHLQIGIETYGG